MFNVFEVFGVVLEVLWTLQTIVCGFSLVIIKNNKLKMIKMPFVTFHVLVV